MLSHCAAAGRFEDAFCGCWKSGEFGSRPTRTSEKFTAAIWALPVKHSTRARLAEFAHERADASLGRFGRKISVAALAIRTQLEHCCLVFVLSNVRHERQTKGREATFGTSARWRG